MATIKELAEQAGIESWRIEYIEDQFERFAELIRQDETKACAKHYLAVMRDAVEQAVLKERELCAKLCDKASYWDGHVAANCAAAIRARGEK